MSGGYLLDTNATLIALTEPALLAPGVRGAILSGPNILSVVVYWEVMLKSMKGTLKVGDPAPALAPGKWLKGEPVKALEKGKIYVVEFWATWCSGCVAQIPHLNELTRKLKDRPVRFISVTDEDRDVISAFLAKRR